MNNIYDVSTENLDRAAEVIKSGGWVAVPTETVYGLGANVYLSEAVAGIFAAKQRPKFDPLISHIANVDFLPEYAVTDERIMELARHFWPGPLTIIMRRQDNNPSIDLRLAEHRRAHAGTPGRSGTHPSQRSSDRRPLSQPF